MNTRALKAANPVQRRGGRRGWRFAPGINLWATFGKRQVVWSLCRHYGNVWTQTDLTQEEARRCLSMATRYTEATR